jgi:hypothetical protein
MSKRDHTWLHQQLDEIWDQHFEDVPQDNIVRIQFGRRAKNRLGSIKLDLRDRETSVITVNGLFRDPQIPAFLVQATIVHELCHYAHGFNSPVEQQFKHPHAGGVMRREFKERGLERLYLEQKKWLKQNWPQVIAENFKSRGKVVKKTTYVPKPFWFIS